MHHSDPNRFSPRTPTRSSTPFPIIISICFMAGTWFPVAGQSGALDPSFNPGSGATGGTTPVIYSAVQKSDGKILIAGLFNTYNGSARNFLAHLDTDGTLDPAFGQTGPNGEVYKVLPLPDGTFLIGGNFSNFGGIARNRIARIGPDGLLDFSFQPGGGATQGIVRDIAVQPDGRAIVAGTFTSYSGQVRNRIVRIEADGTLDNSFNIGSGAGSSAINAVVLQPDGKVLIGGNFTSYNGTDIKHIARLNSDGSLDTAFDPGTGAGHTMFNIAPVNAIALRPDGRIIIGGQFNLYNGVSRPGIASLNTDGSLDTTFDPGTGSDGVVYSLLLREGGKCLVGGSFLEYDGVERRGLARINADGTLDPSFDPGTGATPIHVVAPHTDGKVLIGGGFTLYNGTSRVRIARLSGDGFAGIEEQNLSPVLRIAPSPTTDVLRVMADRPLGQVAVWSVDGRMVIEQRTTGHELVINVGMLRQGSYIVRATSADGRVARGRFVKH